VSNRLITALEQVRTLPVITLGNIVDHVEGEALLILSLVSILPFMQPIPIPGLSSILGLVVLLQGIGLAFWSRPLLSRKMKDIVITHERFDVILKAARKFTNFTSKISTYKHPIVNTRAVHLVCGIAIIFSAGVLTLPLPIPFSNFIPAISIFLICIGLLEGDVMIILSGLAITLTILWIVLFSYQLALDNWF
jgi:hypothetical protein